MIPIEREVKSESTTVTVESVISAACLAAFTVPLIEFIKWIEIISEPSFPNSSYNSTKRPIEG